MTLDEAIKHAEEVAEENSKRAERIRNKMKSEIALSNAVECETCADEHRQLAEWLKDYKRLLEQPTSDDCVSRENVRYMITGGKYADEDYEQFIDRLVEELENMPPVTPTQRWIPVSERLPKDRNLVLVTAYWHETYQVMMASYFGEGLWWCVPFNNCGDHMQKLNPKAWMPLPQPYEEKRGDENDSN